MTLVRIPVEDRIAAKIVVTEDGCHVWTGALDPAGYGRIRVFEGNKQFTRPTHRVAWELANGPIPEGLHLDHLCRNPPCCNADHLDAVTQAENNARARAVKGIGDGRSECIHGHKLDGANTYITPDGRRQCRRCNVKRQQKYANRSTLPQCQWPQLVSA